MRRTTRWWLPVIAAALATAWLALGSGAAAGAQGEAPATTVVATDIGEPATVHRAPASDDSSPFWPLAAVVGLVLVVAAAVSITGRWASTPAEADRSTAAGSDLSPFVGTDPRPIGVPHFPPTAAALVNPSDVPALREALARGNAGVAFAADPAAAFAAVVSGARVLIVDASQPNATDLLRLVRRRIDDGWSDCAVVAYFPPSVTIDVALSPLLDAVARYPLTTGDLDLAIRVACSQRDDRRATSVPPRASFATP